MRKYRVVYMLPDDLFVSFWASDGLAQYFVNDVCMKQQHFLLQHKYYAQWYFTSPGILHMKVRCGLMYACVVILLLQLIYMSLHTGWENCPLHCSRARACERCRTVAWGRGWPWSEREGNLLHDRTNNFFSEVLLLCTIILALLTGIYSNLIASILTSLPPSSG